MDAWAIKFELSDNLYYDDLIRVCLLTQHTKNGTV